ncbi:recombinase family protein [Nocardioides sp. 616]|uniref:recombinase family protein n=1 Tax=Nocardioides sp. 616 TaxID=2268090 RepID=UPI0013B3F80E|nr:recombinase family protein [Nocardioides sp. 616]
MAHNMASTEGTRAGVYARISLDVGGQALGVARQEADCRRKAEALGWFVTDVYVDNDVSASKNVSRPQYMRLLADLEAGRINAVVVYDLDRLTRKPAELETFIDLSDRLSIALANVAGDVDLSTASGRMVARIKGAVARQEADRIGERVKRQKAQRLEAGMPPGSRYRTFGYTRAWDVIEGEAVIVREVFERVARGESVNAVTNDLVARGIRRVSGDVWRYQATTRMLESSIYAGRLSYKGQDAGPSRVPTLVSEALFHACQGRERKAAWNTRSGLLSGIAVCGACHTPMNRDGQGYRCAPIQGGCGRVRIKAVWLDDAVEAAVWFLMTWKRQSASAAVVGDATASLSSAVEEIDRKIAEVQEASTSGALDLADALPMFKSLRAQRAKALGAAEAAIADDETWKHVEDYAGADLSAKRTVIRQHVTAVLVAPTTKPGRNTYEPDRIRVVTPYEGREFSGRDCDSLGDMRDMAMALPVGAFDRIEIGWGEADAGTVVKGQGVAQGLPPEVEGMSGLIVSEGVLSALEDVA